MKSRVSKYPSAFEHSADLLFALLRGQPGPVDVDLGVEFLIPLGFVLSPFPLNKGLKSLFRGETGPRVIFCQVVGKNSSEHAQQGVKGPAGVQVRAYKGIESGCRPRE